jgi:hypothetical protein
MAFRPFGPASLFVRDLFIEPELPRQAAALPRHASWAIRIARRERMPRRTAAAPAWCFERGVEGRASCPNQACIRERREHKDGARQNAACLTASCRERRKEAPAYIDAWAS